MLSGTDMENMLLKSVHEMCIYIYIKTTGICAFCLILPYMSQRTGGKQQDLSGLSGRSWSPWNEEFTQPTWLRRVSTDFPKNTCFILAYSSIQHIGPSFYIQNSFGSFHLPHCDVTCCHLCISGCYGALKGGTFAEATRRRSDQTGCMEGSHYWVFAIDSCWCDA